MITSAWPARSGTGARQSAGFRLGMLRCVPAVAAHLSAVLDAQEFIPPATSWDRSIVAIRQSTKTR
jgi:hypothetical protein